MEDVANLSESGDDAFDEAVPRADEVEDAAPPPPDPTVSYMTYEDARARANMKVEEVREILQMATWECEELLQKHRWNVDAAVEEGSLRHFPPSSVPAPEAAEAKTELPSARAGAGVEKVEDEVMSPVDDEEKQGLENITVVEEEYEDASALAAAMREEEADDGIDPFMPKEEGTTPVASGSYATPMMFNTAHDEITPVLGKRKESPVREREVTPAAGGNQETHIDLGMVGRELTPVLKKVTGNLTAMQVKKVPATRAVSKTEPAIATFRCPGSSKWPRITGNVVACALCFEQRNGNTVLHFATNCGITICIGCWGGFFRAQFSDGVRGLVRCPFPGCNSIVPEWLLEKCYVNTASAQTAALLAAYRYEFLSDFVMSSENLQFCPSPSCELIVRRHGSRMSEFVTCMCEYEFCFECLLESHFPLGCREAKELANYAAQREMTLLSNAFESLKRCNHCGILVENGGGCQSFHCSACNGLLRWSAMISCRDSLEKCSASPFAKRDGAKRIQEQLDFILFQHAKDMDDFLGLHHGDGIDPQAFTKYIGDMKKLLRFMKDVHVFLAVSKDIAEVRQTVFQMRTGIEAFLGHLRDRPSHALLTSTHEILHMQQNHLVEVLRSEKELLE